MKDPNPEQLQQLVGERLGPYNSFNPVSRVQVWQWCSAMGDRSPLYLDEAYQQGTEFSGKGVVAPPAMMQMWTMRDFNDDYAPGSSSDHPYKVMQQLEALGFPGNVAVNYDIQFHRYLVEGDRVHHFKTVTHISDLKTTALGRGYFFTDRMEYLDQNGELFAEALITYFQYQPAEQTQVQEEGTENKPAQQTPIVESWTTDFEDIRVQDLEMGQALPQMLIPIDHRLIVGGAIATQDYIPVHHNAPAAQAAAMPDIFMNILTTSGLSARYLADWAGPASRLKQLKFRLMTPNTPGDTMVMQGRVSNIEDQTVELEFSGMNNLGPHVMGTASIELAD
jgi:hypothetical protein